MDEFGNNINRDHKEWSPSSWKLIKISQQPKYSDVELLEEIKSKVSALYYIII
jgi:hypothetical protein